MYVDLPIVLQARIQASSCAVGQRACCEAEEAATSMPSMALSPIAAWRPPPLLPVPTSASSAGGIIPIPVTLCAHSRTVLHLPAYDHVRPVLGYLLKIAVRALVSFKEKSGVSNATAISRMPREHHENCQIKLNM